MPPPPVSTGSGPLATATHPLPSASPVPTASYTPPAAGATVTPFASPTTASTPFPTSAGTQTYCPLGSGLRRDTTDLATAYPTNGRFVMVSSVQAAAEYYPQLRGALRVLVAPSLEQLQKLAERADQAGIPYEALGYGLEAGRHTTVEEQTNPVWATQEAAALAQEYGKQLVMGPGFQLMLDHWDEYPKMAAYADVWILQSQRLQVDPPGPEYRTEVENVINQILAGNPDIQIWVQISVTPGPTVLSVDEWLAYRGSIADLVDGVFVFDVRDPSRPATMEAIFAAVCGG